MAVSLSEFKAPANAKIAQAKAEVKSESLPGVFVPMGGMEKKFADGTPINSLMVKRRREIVKEWFGDKWREGSIGTCYKSWLYTILSIVAIVIFYGINLWIAAVFAYLAGFFWSEMILNYAWSVEWFKGKALIATK